MAGFQFGPWACPWSEAFFLSRLSLAIVNQKPIMPGHCLVLSRRVVPRLCNLTPEETADLWATVHSVAPVLESHFKGQSLTIAVQDGPVAGQTVPHVHVHIIPRIKGDFKRNDQIYDRLDKHDSNRMIEPEEDRKARSLEEMKAEALTLRPLFQSVSLPIPEDTA